MIFVLTIFIRIVPILKKNKFYRKIKIFFNQIDLLDTPNYQCNMKNCHESIKNCNILLDYFLSKVGIPNPIFLFFENSHDYKTLRQS